VRLPRLLLFTTCLVAAGCAAAPVPGTTGEGEHPRETIVLDLYDVRDLTEGAVPEPMQEPVEAPKPPACRIPGKVIVRLIRETIETTGWAEGAWGIEYREPGTLVIRAPGEIHTGIRRLLGVLRGNP